MTLMLVEHEGRAPTVDPEAWVAPTALLCGDVRVAAGARVLWNAVPVDDGGGVELGERAIVMEHALLRGRPEHPVRIGANVIVGPHAHVNGAAIPDHAFVATGAAPFPGAIWAIQRDLDFPGTVLRARPGAPAAEAAHRYSELFGRHRADRPLPG